MVLAGLVAASSAAFLNPNAGKAVVTAGVAVSVLAFTGLYGWARFPLALRKSSIAEIPILTIGERLKRRTCSFRESCCSLAWHGAWASRSWTEPDSRPGGTALRSSVAWCCSLSDGCSCATGYSTRAAALTSKKGRIAKLGRWSVDICETTELWDACPHCGVSFNEPYR